MLPAAVTVGWFLWARPYLAVEHNQYWTYETDAIGVAENYVAYATSFWNASVSPFILHDPCVLLRDFPLVMAARENAVLTALLFVVAAGLVVAVVYLAITGRPGTQQRRAAGAALGLGLFFIALAPVAVMHDRLLCYYAYFAHFGLSLLVACAGEGLFGALRRSGSARGVVWARWAGAADSG